MKRKSLMLLAIVIFASMVTATPANATGDRMPLVVCGYVFDADGAPCMGPEVTITDRSTGKSFSVMTLPDSNYYLIKPAPAIPDDVKVGDLIEIKATCDGGSAVVERRLDEGVTLIKLNLTIGPDISEVGEITGTEAREEVTSTVEVEATLPPESSDTQVEGEEKTPGFSFALGILAFMVVLKMWKKGKR